jgi:hypothetical protein
MRTIGVVAKIIPILKRTGSEQDIPDFLQGNLHFKNGGDCIFYSLTCLQ